MADAFASRGGGRRGGDRVRSGLLMGSGGHQLDVGFVRDLGVDARWRVGLVRRVRRMRNKAGTILGVPPQALPPPPPPPEKTPPPLVPPSSVEVRL